MINWKLRLKNPIFLAQLFLSFLMPMLTYFGLTVKDLNTWGSFFHIIEQGFKNPYVLGTIVVSLWHAVNDPTTKGIQDSDRAKQYSKPQ